MREMFKTIAPRYDFVSRAFSYGMDRHWKLLGVEKASLPADARVLDLACGTGDFSQLMVQQLPRAHVIGVDLTEPMLQVARKRGLTETVCGDAASLPFADGSFDCVFIGYGLRNFHELERGGAGNQARDAAGRDDGEPGFFPAGEPHFAAAFPRLHVRAGGILGHAAAWKSARLYLHSEFDSAFRVGGRLLHAAAALGIRAGGGARVCFRRDRAALGCEELV